MARVYICKECKKPKSKDVDGKAMKGKKLIEAAQQEDFSLLVLPCKCIGKCKKGPNAFIMPGKKRLHRMSLKRLHEINKAS